MIKSNVSNEARSKRVKRNKLLLIKSTFSQWIQWMYQPPLFATNETSLFEHPLWWFNGELNAIFVKF